ncbi:NF038215 family lipoprotein [Acinetobacter sp. Marseille-Q1623]|uniref:NF038215 family lipoprotein n=1 Tax=Acinetobacter sp. Marseille-Q1623 TaxID=2697501 RepID=UPI00157B834C|nr:NF038215 family lipoprotein [Acinetobacter sp. Marseille-Q1623]
MKRISITFSLLFTFILVSCSAQESTAQKMQEQSRTMIIGGVPVHDKDYRLLAQN